MSARVTILFIVFLCTCLAHEEPLEVFPFSKVPKNMTFDSMEPDPRRRYIQFAMYDTDHGDKHFMSEIVPKNDTRFYR